MKKFLLGMLMVLVVVALGGAAYWWQHEKYLDAFAKAPFGTDGSHLIVIPPGTGPKTLSTLLARGGLVSSGKDFFAWLHREKSAPKLKAGEYEFTGPQTPDQIVQKLMSGQQKLYHFTVPEGLRVDEVLPILAQSELHLDPNRLAELAKDRAFIHKTGVPGDSLEGFLFPDTYSFAHGFTEASVLAKMVSRALEEYKKADPDRKPGVTLDLFQTMTLASIVEKETGRPEDRTHIACVFHNRLKQHIRLGTDPTVLYAMMLLRGKFVKNITSADLRTMHPYNTYMVYGLPPGPIAQPGAAAIHAALNPLDCPDTFFVSRNDGTTVFCPDLKCHEAAVDVWQKQYFAKKRKKAARAHK